MTDPRDMLTEETPENPADFRKRQLTEVGGTTHVEATPRVLTETLPVTEDEDEEPRTLLG
jgi:hypothetical protein